MKACLLGFLIFMFFVLMSRIDYVVNAMLYEYGLRFSYDWANTYWSTYAAVFVAFSGIVGLTYWLGSKRTLSELKISIALFATINLLAIGGLQDILFFLLWKGGLPANNVVWWWMPWVSISGTWNSLMQVGFTALTVSLSAVTWMLALRNAKMRNL